MRVAGAHIKGGKVHLACLKAARSGSQVQPVEGGATRLEFNDGLGEAQRLADLQARLRQDLGAAKVAAVGLVETRSYSNWRYRDAYTRVLAISALMGATTDLAISFETLKTSDIARTVGVAAHELQTFEYSAAGFERAPRYWTTGLAEAYAAAWHLVSTQSADD